MIAEGITYGRAQYESGLVDLDSVIIPMIVNPLDAERNMSDSKLQKLRILEPPPNIYTILHTFVLGLH